MSQGKPPCGEAAFPIAHLTAPVAILIVDRDGRIAFLNAKVAEFFGYEPKELLGRHYKVLLPELFRADPEPPQDLPTTPELLPRRIALRRRGLHKDRSDLQLDVRFESLNAQDGPLICCLLRKVSPGQQPEQALLEMEEQFRVIVENSNDILTIRGADGCVRYTNPSFHRILGYPQEEVIGSTGFDMIHPEDRASVESALYEFWKNPGARDSIQYRARHANGSWVSLEVVAFNLLDHPGIHGVVINGRDISERKQTEAEMERQIADLQEAIAEVNPLTGLLPICASCKKIQNEGGNWQQIESYIRERATVEFSHGMCPDCARRLYPDHYKG